MKSKQISSTKKTLFFLILICLFSLTSCCSNKEKLFQSAYLNYSFKYPASWEIKYHRIVNRITCENLYFYTSSGDQNSIDVIDLSKNIDLFSESFRTELKTFLKEHDNAIIISEKPNELFAFYKDYFISFSYNIMFIFNGLFMKDKNITNKYSPKKNEALIVIKSFIFSDGSLKDVKVLEGDETMARYLKTIIHTLGRKQH